MPWSHSNKGQCPRPALAFFVWPYYVIIEVMMKIFLRDKKQSLVNAWKGMFKDFDNFDISCGDIFAEGPHLDCEAIVSPANSFGYMDGGIDFLYSSYFGWGIGDLLRQELWQHHDGELLVGQAVLIDMRSVGAFPKNSNDLDRESYNRQQADRIKRMPYLISAPTMRVPMNVSQTVNAYLAFVAALRVAKKHDIKSLLCPGLGTAIGQMDSEVCACQMYEAYLRHDKPKFWDVLGNVHCHHYDMLNADTYKGTKICGSN